jgi:hypothetical protein
MINRFIIVQIDKFNEAIVAGSARTIRQARIKKAEFEQDGKEYLIYDTTRVG